MLLGATLWKELKSSDALAVFSLLLWLLLLGEEEEEVEVEVEVEVVEGDFLG